jgi:hypothetical protein
MTQDQATDYLTGTSQIPVADMSKAMFRFLRAAARIVLKAARFRDLDQDAARCEAECFPDAAANVRQFAKAATIASNFQFRPATYGETIPQSAKLSTKIVSKIADPFANLFA